MTLPLLLVAALSASAAAPKAAKAAPKPEPPASLVKAAEAGDAQAQDRLGWWYDDRGDGKTAVVWYKKAADQGWPLALHHLGVMLEGGAEGKGVPRDCAASQDHLRKAAAAGVAASTFRVGYAYYRGVCAEKDMTQARLWFERSKTAEGLFHLGLMAEFGKGRPVDVGEAAALYEKAYRDGPAPMAANQRAHLYYDATPRDSEKAYLWYLRGTKDADADDRARLKALRAALPAAARRRIEAEAKGR